MRFIHRIADTLRFGRDGHRDPATPTAARRRQQARVMSVQRDLDETVDEQAYIEAEMARSRGHAARLDADAAAATADGCADIARELHEELIQTRAFIDELTEVHQTVIADRNRLSALRRRLADHLAEYGEPVEISEIGKTNDAGVLVDRVVPEKTRPADGVVRLEADL
jgi:hypothetical protein